MARKSKTLLEGEIVKPGPECKYKPEYCQIIQDIASQGGHIAAMRWGCGGISKDTWYRWKDEIPEFKEAIEKAKLISQVYWEELGHRGIKGEVKFFNAPTYALMMQSKFEEDYKRGTSTEVNITNNTLTLTSEEVQERIEQKLEKLKSLGLF